tara:strand:+ start:131 stop:802 length:672 start_codon:yes stop_codon:yes gene_type:complete
MAKWSYSSLSLFKQCPRKYYRLRVKKDIKQSITTALMYGKSAHSAAENYIRDNKTLPLKFNYLKQYLDIFKKIDGVSLCEYKMGLTRDLEACEFNAQGAWWRGIADLIILCEEDLAYVIDYKTGKSAEYADLKQLEILSLAVFKHFPLINNIKAGLVFVVSKDLVKAEYERSDVTKLWDKFKFDVECMEKAYEVDVWNPKQNFTCKNYCPVKDCEHNGRGMYE